MRMRFGLLVWCLFVIGGVRCVAGDSLQWRHWGGGVAVLPGRAIVMDSYQGMWQKGRNNLTAALEVAYTPLPSDSDAFARDFGYPTIGAGVRYHFDHGGTMPKEKNHK